MVSAPIRWAALLGASAVSLAWLWRGAGVAGSAETTSAPPPLPVPAPVVVQAAPPVAAPVAPPPPVPYRYVGSWREGDRLHLSLKRGDTITSVTGLASVDAQYVVIAADENQVSLRFLPLGTVQVVRRENPAGAAPGTLARSPAARNNDDTEPQTEN